MNRRVPVTLTHDPYMARGALAVAHWNRRQIVSV